MLTLAPACALPLAVRRDDRLPAVFTRHADPAALFAAGAIASTTEQKVAGAKSDAKGKGRATHAEGEDNDDDGPILPGVKSTWGELPRRKKTPSEKRLEASKTSGKKWFDLPHRPLASLSDAEKRELQALRLSNAMDPKRFMRGEAKRDGKKLPEYFQVSRGPSPPNACIDDADPTDVRWLPAFADGLHCGVVPVRPRRSGRAFEQGLAHLVRREPHERQQGAGVGAPEIRPGAGEGAERGQRALQERAQEARQRGCWRVRRQGQGEREKEALKRGLASPTVLPDDKNGSGILLSHL